MKAKAVVVIGPGKLELREVNIGSVGEWDIGVELEASAISVGTESYVLSAPERVDPPFILGYAPIGRITHVGEKAAAHFQVGERVSFFQPRAPVDMRQSCGGHQSPAIINVNPAERSLLGSNDYCVKVPKNLSSERAAFGGISAVSCMGVGMARPRVGDTALVIGQGMIGQFAAQHLRLRGVEVAVADLHELRLELSRQWGANHAIDSSRQDLADSILAQWSEGADIIVDTTGRYDVIEKSVEAIRVRGKYVFLGWCKGKGLNVDKFHSRVFEAYFPWTLEGKRVLNSWRLMEAEALKVEHLITHRFDAADVQQAFDLILSSPDQYTGVILNW
jgi:2-desacetyl-2-hydroxyethyl bacteriochlorophyllide A dehydrogenase